MLKIASQPHTWIRIAGETPEARSDKRKPNKEREENITEEKQKGGRKTEETEGTEEKEETDETEEIAPQMSQEIPKMPLAYAQKYI